jgi:hypothetical protein
MPSLLDSHAHCFTEAHLDDATKGAFAPGERPPAYTLREHLDGMLAAAPTSTGTEKDDDEIVVVNVAFSALPTSQHVIDSFDELTRLQTLYGSRYSRVKCVLGTCRADEPTARTLLANNPLIIGARVFLKGVAPKDAVAAIAKLGDVTTFLASNETNADGKFLELFATDVETLTAAVAATPPGVPLMIDHLGAWAAPPMDKYHLLLSALATRQQQQLGKDCVLLKGPGHRTSFHAPVTAAYAAAAARALGSHTLLLSATDAPHVFMAPRDRQRHFAQRGFVAGALGLQRRLSDLSDLLIHQEQDLKGAVSEDALAAAAESVILRFADRLGPLAPCPQGMIHARRPAWYTGDDLMIPVPKRTPPPREGTATSACFGWADGGEELDEMMHAVLFRPSEYGTKAKAKATAKANATATAPPPLPSAPPSSLRKSGGRSGNGLVCIVGSGYTGFLGLYPALLSQELTRRGVATIALEYPCYGASEGRGEHEVSIAAQARAWAAAAAFARTALGFDTVVGAAWAMGSAALTLATTLLDDGGTPLATPPTPPTPPPNGGEEAEALEEEKRQRQPPKSGNGNVLFDGVCLLNALLDADRVHAHVIASVNAKRAELERRVAGIPGLAGDVALPPPTLADFRKQVAAMDDGELYAGFAGYPLDAETLDVVIRQLCEFSFFSFFLFFESTVLRED